MHTNPNRGNGGPRDRLIFPDPHPHPRGAAPARGPPTFFLPPHAKKLLHESARSW